MYESPINIIFQNIEWQIDKQAEQTEQTILDAIRKCAVDVNKDELIKALNYDRNQYNKGYVDGVRDVLNKIRNEIDQLSSYVAKFTDSSFAIHIDKENVLHIIDKYLAEIRPQEGEHIAETYLRPIVYNVTYEDEEGEE